MAKAYIPVTSFARIPVTLQDPFKGSVYCTFVLHELLSSSFLVCSTPIGRCDVYGQ